MPGMDVLVKLRELNPEAAVVIASADVQAATRHEAIGKGARAYLTKPYAARDVLGAVERALSEGARGNDDA
jgi:two-component system, chemotaxis family, chemotaxis protein CheY